MTTQTSHITHEEEAEAAGYAAVGALRAFEVAPFVLIGLLVCPPLAILAVLVVVPLLVMALVAGLLALVFATPYLVYEHARGHRGHLPLLGHRLRHAGRAVLDLAPHRIAAGARVPHPGR
jgi:uncharacterized membrane protein